ncbi:MAG: hypothetical protein U0Q16_13535 [Bryobacteraceae bacterium]
MELFAVVRATHFAALARESAAGLAPWIVKAQDYLRAPVLLAQPGLADEKIR